MDGGFQKIWHVLGASVTSGALGFLAICLPSWARARLLWPSPLFPWVHTAVSVLQQASFGLLFLVGFIVVRVFPTRPLLIGICSVAVFPVLATIEKTVVMFSHRHYPLEFMLYMLLGLATYLGALSGGRFPRSRL